MFAADTKLFRTVKFIDDCNILQNDLNTLAVYRQAIGTLFRMLIYPMLNQWNANPMTPNPGL